MGSGDGGPQRPARAVGRGNGNRGCLLGDGDEKACPSPEPIRAGLLEGQDRKNGTGRRNRGRMGVEWV